MTPTIYVERTVTYAAIPDGKITLACQFTADNPFLPGTRVSVNQTTQVAQPNPWTSDEQVIEALQVEFPEALVLWMPLPEPPVVEAPVEEPVVDAPVEGV